MSKSYITLKALNNKSPHNNCHLLQINNYKILLNIGSHDLDYSYLEEHRSTIESCDTILLSNFSLKNIGGLPFLCKTQFNTNIYSTIPTSILGKICIDEVNNDDLKKKEIHKIKKDKTKMKYYFKKEITAVFEKIVSLKYSQPVNITGSLKVTACNSGNTLGGTIWKIETANDCILFGIDINHKKENHLDGIDFDNFENVNCMIFNVNDKIETIRKNKRNQKMEELIINHNQIFIPISYQRFFEFISILEPLLMKMQIKALVIGKNIKKFKRKTQNMVEWMGENTLKVFNVLQDKIFDFKNIKFGGKRITKEFKIILSIDDSMEYSYSKLILKKISQDQNNLIIFANDTIKNTLQEKICSDEKKITIKLPKRVLLSEQEFKRKKDICLNKEKKKEEEKKILDFLKNRENDSEENNEVYLHDKEVAKKMFWHEYKYDFWIDDENIQYASFPQRKQAKFNEYGEIFVYKNEIEAQKIEEKLEDKSILDNKKEIKKTRKTKVIWRKKTLDIKCKVEKLDFAGLCEFKSMQYILEKIQPEKIVFIGENIDVCKFYHSFFSFNPNFEKIFYLQKELNLSYDANVIQINLEDDFIENINFRKIKDYKVGAFTGKICKNNDTYKLEYVKPPSLLTYSDFLINDLKRMFIENGLRTEIKGDDVIVEEEVLVSLKTNTVTIDGDLGEIYEYTKKILFKNIAFLK